MAHFTISKKTLRRFILGRQGLWPGRRWAGKEGAAEALRTVEAVQIDPLNVVARKAFAFPGMTSARGWRNMFSGFLERKVDQAEAHQRLEALLAEGEVMAVQVEGHKDPL